MLPRRFTSHRQETDLDRFLIIRMSNGRGHSPAAAVRFVDGSAREPGLRPSGNPPLPIPDEMRLQIPDDAKLAMAS
jgi:hypothetical protein